MEYMIMTNQISAKLERAVSLLVLTCIAAFAASTAQALPRPTAASYARGAQITVAGYDASKPALSGFPVLVRIADDSPSGFAYSQLQSPSDGADLCFIDMDGNGLPFEIDTWNPDGTSFVWVTLPSMEHGTQFVMCWGSATSGKTVCGDNPFAGYKGVWHMNATSPADASGSGNDGTAAGSPTIVSGKIGSALSLPNTSAYVTCSTSLPNPQLASGFTVEGWANSSNLSGNHALFGKKQFISVRTESSGSIKVTTPGVNDHNGVSVSLSTGTWFHWAMTFVPGNGGMKFYVNGEIKNTQNASGFKDSTGSTEMWLGHNEWGGQEFLGNLDEYRLSASIRSADWIYATYATQNDAAFLTAGEAQTYEETAAPDVGLSAPSSGLGYTNATLTATIGSLGMDDGMATDADWVDACLVVSTNADLSDPLCVLPLNRITTVPASVPVAVSPLVTNTTYYAQLQATNSFGVAGESGVATFTTRAPGAPAGVSSFLSRGFTTLSASGCATDFGTGAQSATLRLEASTDGFTNIVASTDISATSGQTETLVAENLTPGATYRLRVRILNDWGLATYLDLPNATTYSIPFAVTGLGYSFSSDGSTVDFTFGVFDVFDGATGTATLEYDGLPVSSKTVSAAGSLVWSDVPSSGRVATATVTVTSDVNGTTYTHEWAVTVAPGTAAYVVSSLPELANIVFRAGDSATLPEPAKSGDYYLPLDVRVFSIDGTTLTALEPGFSAICAMEWDAVSGAFVRNATMGLAVCIPEAAGRVFLADAGNANMSWSETAKWRCLTDPSVTGTYPNGAGDVAMVPLAQNCAITLDVDATVGAVYVGWNASAPAANKAYFRATNHTLTFDTGAVDADKNKVPGLFRITGLTRADVNTDRPEFTFGGSGAANRLVVVIPDGLDIDGGKCTDYANTTLRNNHNRLRFWNGYGDIAVPAGKTLHFDHFDHSSWSDTQMGNCSGFVWSSGFPITGVGTIIYDSAAFGYFNGALKDFAGTFVIRHRQRFHAKGVDSRGGGFWLRAGVGYAATNATFVIEGESDYADAARNALGLATYGSTHGSGAWGPGDNSFGGKAMVMAGGVLVHRGNNNSGWVNNGIFNLPNRSDALVVSNGYSVIEAYNYQSVADGVPTPTNRMEFASLRHANRGTLRVSTTDTANYSQSVRKSSSHCIVQNAEGFAIGGGGMDGSYKESVIPWIVSQQQYNNRIYFPYLGTRDGETNCLVLYKHPTSKQSLAAATDPDENVFVHEKSIALSENLTVNALYLNKNWSKGTALGAGKTLTVTSGGVVLEGDRAAIGQEGDFTAGTAGTLRLPNEGYLYSTQQTSSEPNEIWASIVAPKGLAISFPGFLRLGGDQTGIDEEIAINGCDVTFGSATAGCTIDVPVRLESGAAKLRIAKAGSFCEQDLYLNDHACVGPKFVPAAGTEERVHKLYVNGALMRRGYYGSSESGVAALGESAYPAFVDDEHFSGTGWIKVLKDDSAMPFFIMVR